LQIESKKEMRLNRIRCETTIDDIDRECLRYWSELVKLRAGLRCEYPGCNFVGTIETLEAHHYFTKRMYALRLDPENGLSHCKIHHTQSVQAAHGGDGSYRRVIVEGSNGYPPSRSKEWLDSLIMKKRQIENPWLEWYVAKRDELYQELTRIRALNDRGIR
jgi:hypothetical protein